MIIDEGHNIEDACREALSLSIPVVDIEGSRDSFALFPNEAMSAACRDVLDWCLFDSLG